MYQVTFTDFEYYMIDHSEEFNTFEAAAEYWQDYADTETCVAGKLEDLETGEIIWEFDSRI
jgi:hypothetical protein